MKDMIGYCGLDCEKCDAYIATVNDDQTLREKTAKLWAELNNAPIVFCQVLFLKKSVGIPFFQQGIFLAFSGHHASLRMRACSIR